MACHDYKPVKSTCREVMARIAFFLTMLLMASCENVDGNHFPETTVDGIDISHFQGDIDWTLVAISHPKFAYIKVSEGISFEDPKFERNWNGAKEAGLFRGGYHVFKPDDDGTEQAQFFLKRLNEIGADHNGSLPPALDIEAVSKDQVKAARQEIAKWLETVETEFGCKPLVYTSPDHWNAEFPNQFSEYGLWLADYDKRPLLPEGWTDWEFWQHSNKGNIRGIKGDVDLDLFNGNEGELLLKLCVGW